MTIPAFSHPVSPRQRGPHVWRTDDVSDPRTWIWHLTDDEVVELVDATRKFERTPEADLVALTRSDFSFPTVGPKLREMREGLLAGRGFQLIRGLPTRDMTEEQAAAVFVGVGIHMGSARSQNAAGDLLGHVRNIGLDASDPNVRIYQTSQRQTFHTDSTDVVGLLCLEDAAEGGESLLVSVAAVYNEMLDRDRDLAAVLFAPIATDRRGEVPEGEDPFFTIPVLTWHDNALTVVYQRQYIESAQRFPEAPRLTSDVVAALDLFDEIANDPSFHLRMRLAVGDMQFVHNHGLLHDRTGYLDKEGAPRHLLRLWLSVPGDRELPDAFASRFGRTTIGDRGGIVVSR
jgi:hypothetical protein